MRFELGRDGALNARIKSKRHDNARVALCRPLTAPAEQAVVYSAEGKELALIPRLSALDKNSRQALTAHLRRRTLTAAITRVKDLAQQFGAIYWDVETDRGPREFVLKGVTEHVRFLSEKRMLITDVDGNRFEIKDLSALDKASQDLIDLVL